MADDASYVVAKQKKLASARKKLKQFQQRKTSPAPSGGGIVMEGRLCGPLTDGDLAPVIDDMSTWPDYNKLVDSPLNVDYSLNGSYTVSSSGNGIDNHGDVQNSSYQNSNGGSERLNTSGHVTHSALDESPASGWPSSKQSASSINDYANSRDMDNDNKEFTRRDNQMSMHSDPIENLPLSPQSVSPPNGPVSPRLDTLSPTMSQYPTSAIAIRSTSPEGAQQTSPTVPLSPTSPVNPTSSVSPTSPMSPTSPVSRTAPLNPTSPVNPTSPGSKSFPGVERTTTASTEGLHQLSRKITGLISESKDCLNGDLHFISEDDRHELELRNRELASSVEKLHQENEKWRIGYTELTTHNTQLSEQLKIGRAEFDEKLRKEMTSVKEQLQVHIQTIGILVAEKSELQSSVAQTQKDLEKRSREVEELSGRLKASRTRVSELERDISTSSTSSQHFEKVKTDLTKEVDRLRSELYTLTKNHDETKRQNAELQEKLQVKTSECEAFDQSIGSMKHMLEMKDVLIQQLSSEPSDVHAQAVDLLQQERVELINRLEQYNEAFHQLTAERDHITDQYQTYIDQLSAQIASLQNQLSVITDQKEALSQSLHELQQQNESLSDQIKSDLSLQESKKEDRENFSELQTKMDSLTADYDSIKKLYDEQSNNNSQLTRMISERESKILELETEIQGLREDSVDRGQLLDSIQNDKASLSRALAQNRDLRSQLEELQTAFVKMSNENMEMATQLSTEQHTSKKYSSRLHFLEHELDEKIAEIETMQNQLADAQTVGPTGDSSNVETIESNNNSSVGKLDEDSILEHAHCDEDILALENKYMQLTRDKADLLDRNERLEHMVTQLEGETDTIGEYITIYHHERAMLADREKQKEIHLQHLARDREEMKAKLAELQALVAQLISEKDGYRHNPNTSLAGTVLERKLREGTVTKIRDEDDWPSSSGDDSDSSESVVEAVEITASHTSSEYTSQHVSKEDQVAQKIMNLIEEIGSRDIDNMDHIAMFSPCKCCTGKLQVV